MMTDDERAAREWLLEAYNYMYTSEEEASYRATILRLLDRPVCPRGEDVPQNWTGDYSIVHMVEADDDQ